MKAGALGILDIGGIVLLIALFLAILKKRGGR